MSARAVPGAPTEERAWWLRTLLVLGSPRSVFAALRDDSQDAAHARQEPLLAIVWLAGIAGVLMSGITGRVLDDAEFDGLVLVVWAFLAGGIEGLFGYFLIGGLVFFAASLLGSLGTFRRARHLVGYAAVPLVLSLVVWPVRLAVHGSDTFRTGGSDTGSGATAFTVLEAAFVAWAVVLLTIGVRTVHGWGRLRSLAVVALAATPLVLLFRVLDVVSSWEF